MKKDDKGRITIPLEIRRVIGEKTFKAELLDKDTIILRACEDSSRLVKRISDIKLSGDPERASMDAAVVKDLYCRVRYRES